MSRDTARQQERACASFDCADSRNHGFTRRHRGRQSLFQRCVLILLVQALVLGPVHAAPTAVVEPAIASTHALATTIGLSIGNPILPATAEKFQSETDFTDAGPAPLSFGRFYRSTWGADTSRPAGVLGTAWTHTYSASLRATPAVNPVAVTITSAEGYVRTFAQPAGASSWSATNSADSLTWTPAAWIYRRADDETGMGGANSAGSTQYIYLPTANGPMPIAAVINGQMHAVHSDHLNTPRRLTDSQGQAVWQWAYSAFGEEKPTLATYRFANLDINPHPGMTNISAIGFNLRYPGQYFDKESGLHYNLNRTYDGRAGRYTQPDPRGLDAGWNRIIYVDGNPLGFIDPEGLQAEHTKNARPSTEQKHQDAEARRQRDAGGEKGDKRRRPPSKRPPGYKGPWPLSGIIPLVCPLCDVMEPEPLPGPELCQKSVERKEW